MSTIAVRAGRPPLPGFRCEHVSRTGRRCPDRARGYIGGVGHVCGLHGYWSVRVVLTGARREVRS